MPRRRGPWAKLEMKYKVLVGAMSFLVLSAAAVKAWVVLEFPILATQAWVIDAQLPLYQQGQRIEIGLMRSRISAIKDLLVSIEEKKAKAQPGDKVRLDQQARDLNKEWADIEASIKSMEATKR